MHNDSNQSLVPEWQLRERAARCFIAVIGSCLAGPIAGMVFGLVALNPVIIPEVLLVVKAAQFVVIGYLHKKIQLTYNCHTGGNHKNPHCAPRNCAVHNVQTSLRPPILVPESPLLDDRHIRWIHDTTTGGSLGVLLGQSKSRLFFEDYLHFKEI
jgi:hypothetical protein